MQLLPVPAARAKSDRKHAPAQLADAALDVEVLVQLYERFTAIHPELELDPVGTS